MKRDNALALEYRGAAAMDVVPIDQGRWAIIAVVGNPPRIVILHVELVGQPPPPSPLPEAGRLAREWLAVVPAPARARAGALAEAFRAVASDIESGKLKDAAAIIQASTERNRAALGEDRNAWLPWFEKLREYMNSLAESGKLKTPEDHAVLFGQIAEGLSGT